METVFGPIGDSDVLGLTASSQAFALGTMATANPAIRLIALNPSHLAWYLKFGTSGAVTVSRTDGMRLVPGSKEKPVVIPVPSGSTHVAILCEGASGNILASYGGFDNGEFSPAGASQIVAVTTADQRVALPALAADQPAIRLVSMASNIQSLWIKLGDVTVTGDMASSMKISPGSVEAPALIPVTDGETHLSIFCEGVGGDVVLTPGGIATGINFPTPVPTPMTVGLREISDISGGDTAIASDRAKIIKILSGTGTLAFDDAATLGADWFCYIDNADNTGDVTLNPDGGELIDGLSSWILYSRGVIMVQCDGSAFRSVLLTPMRKVYTANDTFTKPGCGANLDIEGWPSGGAGARGGAGNGGAGGGGGGYKAVRIPLSSVAATEAVTIGAAVPGHTTSTTGSGTSGNNTTFGSLFTAYAGGGGGLSSTRGGGGGGGGGLAAGSQGTGSGAGGGAPDGGGGGGDNTAGTSREGYGGAGGGGAGSGSQAGAGGNSGDGGAGGGGGSDAAGVGGAGGSAVRGGAGGGGASDQGTAGAGGTSQFGGNGGAGATGAADAGDGVAPGGGGGGSESGTSGDGARGELRLVIS